MASTDNSEPAWANGQYYSGGDPDHPQDNIHLPAQGTNQLRYQMSSSLGQGMKQRMRNGASKWPTPELCGDFSLPPTPDTLSVSSGALSTRFTREDQVRSKDSWNSYAEGGVLQDDLMRVAAFEAQAQPHIMPTYDVTHKIRRSADARTARTANKQAARTTNSRLTEADNSKQPKTFKHISGRHYGKKTTNTTVPHQAPEEAVEENLIDF
jgi:hypothetical protein